MAANFTMIGGGGYDRAQQVKQFDDSKLGVKGLVDSGLSSIPQIFIHPPETLSQLRRTTRPDADPIPLIDLSAPRADVVKQVSGACRKFGFFQITNHGVPSVVLDRTLAAVKAFHEQPAEVKSRFYRREMGHGLSYLSNFDLYTSNAASWRDTISVTLGPTAVAAAELPEICRDEIGEWNSQIQRLGEELLSLASEGLGLPAEKLKELTCHQGRVMVGHYYPPCPQPDLTVGLTSHCDPGVLAVVLQDHIGGLQVKHGEDWLDVKPVPGALVINVGVLLQIMSNEEYKSVDHRVLANPSSEVRVSVAVFMNPSNREGVFGPLPELVTPEKPTLYKEFKFSEFMTTFLTEGLDGKTLANYYKL